MAKPKKAPVPATKPYIRQLRSLKKRVSTSSFAKVYILASLLILFATVVFWALLSAKVQQGNADQLVNSLQFAHSSTFHGALIPGQHTFLLKWPIFLLIALFGSSTAVITAFTVGVVVVTIAALVVLLHRIEKRPLVFGTLCLALASVLLVIPAQPYAGGLLPVNMAMLSTRNLEYVLYIVGLVLLIKTPRIKSWRFLLAILAMALLFASDKLFLTISIVGALIALVVYARLQIWKLVNLSVGWLFGSLIGGVGALALLWFINNIGLTHIVSQSSVSPYGLVHSVHSLVLGCVYAFLGMLTNFGANPAANYTILRDIPSQIGQGLKGPGGITFIINLAILVAGIWAVYHVIKASLTKAKSKARFAVSNSLATMLIWTSVVAIGIFIFTNHDYAVDSRYLSIMLFAVFVSGAVYLRTRQWQPYKVVFIGLLITIGIILGLFTVLHSYNNETLALNTVNQRNSLIASALLHHKVDTLVGDYWRVVPTQLAADNKLSIDPLSGCTEPRNALTSRTWQTNLHDHSFAYLFSVGKGLTDYPVCSYKQITATYGIPNESVLIAGDLSKPKELLLFYDHGIDLKNPSNANQVPVASTAPLPIALNQLPNNICSTPTIMNIVAHEDDDLLFMSPDLIDSIKTGDCVTTVYMTAGDGGNSQFYWLDREQGSEAAYSYMIGSKAVWVHYTVKLANNEYITVANPKGNTKISLIFMHLPDGGLKGLGFPSSNHQSLAELEDGNITTINSVDKQSYYTLPQLTAALTTLMQAYQPSEIRTQANYISTRYPDHSDHIAVGNVVTLASAQYDQQQFGGQVTIPVEYYIGYPIHAMPANVSGADLQEKEGAYLAYAKYDGATCQTVQLCLRTPTYSAYLARQYQYKS